MQQSQDLPARPGGTIATVAPRHGETLERAASADSELEGWRRNELRHLAGRVEELERQLRRRTWLLGGGFGLSLLAATALSSALWLPQPLNPWPIARPAAIATAPPPAATPAEPVAAPPPAVAERTPPAPPVANAPSVAAPELAATPLPHPQGTEHTAQDANPNPIADQSQAETSPATTTEPAAGPPALSTPSVSLPSVTVDPGTPATPSTAGTTPPESAKAINRLTAPDPAQ